MKQIYKQMLLFAVVFFSMPITNIGWGKNLIEDNFEYGSTAKNLTALASSNWKKHDGSGNIGSVTSNLSMTGYFDATISLSTSPTITITGTPTAFKTNQGTASKVQDLSLKGKNLTAGVTVTAPTGFEVSTDGNTYAKTKTISADNAKGDDGVIISVRINKDAQEGSLQGNLTFSSQGAASKTVALQGTVLGANTPFITKSGTLKTFIASAESVSSVQYLTISGFKLNKPITVTASEGFEVSSDDGKTFGKSTDIPIDKEDDDGGFDGFRVLGEGKIEGKEISIRLARNTTTGDKTGNISLTSDGATAITIDLKGKVTPKAVVKKIKELRSVDKDGKATFDKDTKVKVTGVIHGVNFQNQKDIELTIIEGTNQPKEGIKFYINRNDFEKLGDIYDGTFAEKDSVEIEGKVSQRFGVIQLSSISYIKKIASGKTLFKPTLVRELNEDTESRLVRIDNITVADTSKWKGKPGNSKGFNFNVSVGKKTINLRIDGDVELARQTYKSAFGNLKTGISIIGLGGQYDRKSPYTSGYQLLPWKTSSYLRASKVAIKKIIAFKGKVAKSDTTKITGLKLKEDITVVASTDFEISKDNKTFTNSLTYAKSSTATVSADLFIRPKTVSVGVKTGKVEIKSKDLETITLNVSADIKADEPKVIVTPTTAIQLESTVRGTASKSKSFKVSGANLLGKITLNIPAEFEISTDDKAYKGSLDLTPISGKVAESTIYVRAKGTNLGDQTGKISISSNEVTTTQIDVSASVYKPTITSVKSVSSFIAVANTVSEVKSFKFSGSNLSEKLTVKLTSDKFEISKDNKAFASTLTFSPKNKTIQDSVIYVKAKTAKVGKFKGDITLASKGADSVKVAISSTINTQVKPTLAKTGDFKSFETNVGTPSAKQSIKISGSDLEGNVTVKSATVDFEVSKDGKQYSPLITFIPKNKKIADSTFFVRAKGTNSGAFNGNLIIASNKADSIKMPIKANVKANPSISVTGSIVTFEGDDQNASVKQKLVISGKDLKEKIKVGAPKEFEVSTDGTNYADSVFFTPTNKIVEKKNLFIRVKKGVKNGNPKGDLLITSKEATTFKTELTATISLVKTIKQLRENKTRISQYVKVKGTIYGKSISNSKLQVTIIEGSNKAFEGIGTYIKLPISGFKKGDLKEGDEIEIIGKLGSFNGLAQLSKATKITKLGTKNISAPTVVTKLGEDTESRFIKLENVKIDDKTQWKGKADNTKAFNVNVTLANGKTKTVIRIDETSFYAKKTYKEVFGKSNIASISGIGGQYDNKAPHDSGYQLFPWKDGQIKAKTTRLDANVTSITGLDAKEGKNSEVKFFTLKGEDLISDVTVEVSDNFEISMDKKAYAKSLKIEKLKIDFKEFVLYVRSTTKAKAGKITGTINFSANNIEKKSFNISGTITTETKTLGIIESSLVVYPNPSESTVRIESKTEMHVEILTLDGRKLIEAKSGTNINVQGLSTGTYIVKITSVTGEVRIEKLVKR